MATCGEALFECLQNYGVEAIFGIPGVHTVELYRGLSATRIKHYTPRHEQGAGFMADGYARACGKPGVCLIITGPGMTNIATAMAQALACSIPMLVISSVNRKAQLTLGEGRLHELPHQRNLISGISVFSHTLLHPNELPKVLARAFAVFKSERPGPVHIEIPIDVITTPVENMDTTVWPLPAPPAPNLDDIKTAARLLANSSHPLIIIGGGAVYAGAAVKALAEKLDAPVINTVNAKGVLPYTHPLSVGGSGSDEVIREAFQTADVVLAVGTEFAETDYDFFSTGDIQIAGCLIRIDIDYSQLTRNLKPTLAIKSDATYALTTINHEIAENSFANQGAQRTQSMRERIKAKRDPHYAEFFAAIRTVLADVVIVGDSTQPTYYAWLYYECEQARSYFHSASGYGTLGYAIPAAIGAKLGNPKRPVISLIGDGGAQFTIAELASAVEAQTAVIFLLWNNHGYGEIRHFMQNAGVANIGVDLYTPDFLTVARGFGCESIRVQNIEQLKSALVTANKRKKPTVIEVYQEDFSMGHPVLC